MRITPSKNLVTIFVLSFVVLILVIVVTAQSRRISFLMDMMKQKTAMDIRARAHHIEHWHE